jgi:hypothetical protein
MGRPKPLAVGTGPSAHREDDHISCSILPHVVETARAEKYATSLNWSFYNPRGLLHS